MVIPRKNTSGRKPKENMTINDQVVLIHLFTRIFCSAALFHTQFHFLPLYANNQLVKVIDVCNHSPRIFHITNPDSGSLLILLFLSLLPPRISSWAIHHYDHVAICMCACARSHCEELPRNKCIMQLLMFHCRQFLSFHWALLCCRDL